MRGGENRCEVKRDSNVPRCRTSLTSCAIPWRSNGTTVWSKYARTGKLPISTFAGGAAAAAAATDDDCTRMNAGKNVRTKMERRDKSDVL